MFSSLASRHHIATWCRKPRRLLCNLADKVISESHQCLAIPSQEPEWYTSPSVSSFHRQWCKKLSSFFSLFIYWITRVWTKNEHKPDWEQIPPKMLGSFFNRNCSTINHFLTSATVKSDSTHKRLQCYCAKLLNFRCPILVRSYAQLLHVCMATWSDETSSRFTTTKMLLEYGRKVLTSSIAHFVSNELTSLMFSHSLVLQTASLWIWLCFYRKSSKAVKMIPMERDKIPRVLIDSILIGPPTYMCTGPSSTEALWFDLQFHIFVLCAFLA